MYRASKRGQPPIAPAQLALATIVQAYTGASDDEVIEATLMDRRWQLVLDCLDTDQAPFSKGTLVAFRKRLIDAQMDRRLIERTIELASLTQKFGSREGEQDNAALWAKIRALDENSAHQVSHHIVQFAREHHASILVFEHLGHFKPQKGKYSKRGNEKRSYWLRGKIFRDTKYKAWNEGGLITCRVSPRNTSRECARCGNLVARYDAASPAEGYTPGAPLVSCPQCQMRGNADRNASIVIGKRLLARYQTPSDQTTLKEKPQAPLHTERSTKVGGVRRSQDAKGFGRPSTDRVRHGSANA